MMAGLATGRMGRSKPPGFLAPWYDFQNIPAPAGVAVHAATLSGQVRTTGIVNKPLAKS
jgi:hypothetical protein